MTTFILVGFPCSLMLLWFGLSAWDENRRANARLEVFEAAHPRPEAEK